MSLTFVSKTRVIATGRIFFALGLIGIGCQHFFFGQFIPLVAPIWPTAIPGRLFWVYLVGAILMAGGGAILAGVKARLAAMLIGALFLLSFVLLHVPGNLMARALSVEGWADALTALTLAGGCLVVAGTLPAAGSGSSLAWLDKLIPLGMYPLAFMVIVFGADHFIHVKFVASMVPAWIPAHIFWTYFAGTALIASGVGMITRIKSRLAATLLGVMLLTWVLILHIPRAIADPYSGIGGEWTSVFEALAESGIAFILGESLSERERQS
jgi:uncharacterized membrane protein